MRSVNGISGATLLYGAGDPMPDLVTVMQFLVDDLRAEGRRISGLRLSASSLRLRADEFEIALTLVERPLSTAAMDHLTRPFTLSQDAPDTSRARLIRNLRDHSHALGFILRRRGALPANLEDLARTLAWQGRVSLLPVFEAAPPTLMIWQPGGLLFTASEFLSIDINTLLSPPDPRTRLVIGGALRSHVHRPSGAIRPSRPILISRSQRADRISAGRAFATSRPHRPRVLPQLVVENVRVTTALRAANQPDPPPASTTCRTAKIVAVLALWGVLAQIILSGGLSV